MGYSKNFENLIPGQQTPEIPREEMLDQAIKESQERIKSKLRLLNINVKGITDESAMIFDRLTENKQNLFPEVILHKAVKELMASDPLFNEEKLDRAASVGREYIEQPVFDTPEAKQAYIDEFLSLYSDAAKDEIMTNPNKYYTKDIFQDYAGIEKTTEQGITHPNTGA